MIGLAYITERIHRYVFDNIYIQEHKINFIDKVVLIIYNLLTKMNPDFRNTLKFYFEGARRYIRYT